jgi:hypothetical protein
VGQVAWPETTRDLRGRPGRMSSLAQVFATQETAVLFTACAARTVESLASHVPLDILAPSGIACVCHSTEADAFVASKNAGLLIAEWDAGDSLSELLQGRSHAIVFDPPYRTSHVRLVSELVAGAASAHLLYGDKERGETQALLRYLVHPRFAMVCLYKAMQGGEMGDHRLLSAGRDIAFAEVGLMLSVEQMQCALAILRELGLERTAAGKAKLDARQSAAYQEAEARYRECVGLCLTL